jgi:hypothetical protein
MQHTSGMNLRVLRNHQNIILRPKRPNGLYSGDARRARANDHMLHANTSST